MYPESDAMSDFDIFLNAPENASSDELSAYLDRHCAGDATLRSRVATLLAADAQAGEFMESPPLVSPAADAALVDEITGSVIGNYQILEEIGRGGFGTVYLADQLAPVKRCVAFKIVKLGMDTQQVIARFEAERQALALMDHPHIAKVYDAGATDTGRPYFVMEWVKGVPITRFCNVHQLPLRKRLSLFVDVCAAVQHAHQKGIIHRDLKPSNILIALHDDKAIPKVIDFGVAKATRPDLDLTDKTLVTQTEQFLGTPAYMSPEQTRLIDSDIDTRSDIYALGVLLYELLTGSTPFDAKTLAKAGQEEIRRVIREEEPPKPSTRLTTLQKEAPAEPTQEGMTPPARIDPDLDWIVMKALEKDRDRRYETANGLAADVGRYLRDEPVTAGAPSAAYRFNKFARRHRLALTTAAAVVGALLIGTSVSTWLAIEARRARAESVASEQNSQLRFADEQLLGGKSALGIAKLAQLIRKNPNNRIAAERLMSAFQHREMPRLLQVFETGASLHAEFSSDGKHVLTVNHQAVHIWETSRGALLRTLKPQGESSSVSFATFMGNTGEVIVRFVDASGNLARYQRWHWKTDEMRGTPWTEDSIHGLASFLTSSPDGKLILGGHVYETWVWNTEKDEVRKSAHVGVHGDISADGQWVVTGGNNANIPTLWNPATGERIHELKGHQKGVWHVRFNADARRLVSTSVDLTARLWDVATGQQVGQPMVHADRIQGAEFSPDGTLLVTASKDGTARFWDATTGEERGRPLEMEHLVWSAGFNKEGTRVLTASRGGQAQVWDVITRRPVGEPMGQAWAVNAAHFGFEGKQVLTWDKFSHAYLWSTDTIQPVALTLRHVRNTSRGMATTNVWAAAFSPDGRSLVTGGMDGKARVWDLSSGKPRHEALEHRKGGWRHHKISRVAYSTDGSLILTLLREQTVSVWDATTGEQVHEPPLRGLVYAEFSQRRQADGDYWLLAKTADHRAVVMNASTGKEIRHFAVPGQRAWTENHGAVGAGFSPDGKWVAMAYGDGEIQVWDLASGSSVASWRAHSAAIRSLRFSGDSQRIITASLDGTARIWDPFSGAPLGPPLRHSKQVKYAEFSPDSTRVVTASFDATARVWDAATGEPIELPMRHAKYVASASFSPDGGRILTCSADKTARVWDAATGHPLSEPLAHDDIIISATFSPDGQRVATTGTDLMARVWEIPSPPLGPVPLWVPEWAEAMVQLMLEDKDNPSDVPLTARHQAEKQVQALADDGYYSRIAKWFQQKPRHRPISPFSPISFEIYVENRIRENTIASLEEALRVDPNHRVALSRIAQRDHGANSGDPVDAKHRARAYAQRALAQPGWSEENAEERARLLRLLD